jgi:ornithine cyclodeaminase/alanine dehydrogenase-like protein (mu-crystallin family)
MTDAIRLVEDVLHQHGEGAAENRPRSRITYPGGMFHFMAAAVPRDQSAGLKAYVASSKGARFVVLLFDIENNVLLSVLEADWLGRIRTGAASGVATRALARSGARVAGVIGAGSQAETQIEAIATAVQLDSIKIFSRTRSRVDELVARLQPSVAAELVPVPSPDEAVTDSDIVVTITTSGEPVFDGTKLKRGAHVNAAGTNRANRREIDSATVLNADFIAVDSLEQARLECGDLLIPAQDNPQIWSRVVELGSVFAGKSEGRTGDSQITLYESQGVALEDVAVARFIYERATREGLGQHVAFGGSD